MDEQIKGMIDRISCGVHFGNWSENFFSLGITYPECEMRSKRVYEEYKDQLFIDVCNSFLYNWFIGQIFKAFMLINCGTV